MNTKAHLFKILTGSILFADCTTAQQKDSKKPNILFIVSDDLGWADLKCYGAAFQQLFTSLMPGQTDKKSKHLSVQSISFQHCLR